MLLLSLTAVGCGNVDGTLQVPSQDSTIAANTDSLYYFIFWVCVVYFVTMMLVMAGFMLHYRRRPGVDVEPSAHANLPLQIAWSIPPAILVAFMFWWGFTGYVDMSTPPADAYEIQVIAKQYDFRFIYPNGLESSELHVPKGEPVKVVLTSEDVLHAFFIPKFRVKQDIVPGRYTEAWFEPTRASKTNPIEFNGLDPQNPDYVKGVDHWLFCAEYCGTNHATMRTPVTVHETRADFEAWLKFAAQPPTPEVLYAMHCASCHSLDGSPLIGPSLKGLYGSQRKVLDTVTKSEASVPADEDYILESIKNPGAKLSRMGKEFGNLMDPSLGTKLGEEEIESLIDYLKTQK